MHDTTTKLLEAAQEVTALREEVAALQAQLAECYRLSGADPSGGVKGGVNEDWRLAECAVKEVRRMREEADRLQDLLDCEAGIWGPEGWTHAPMWEDPYRVHREMWRSEGRHIERRRGGWWWEGVLYPYALEAIEAARTSRREG